MSSGSKTATAATERERVPAFLGFGSNVGDRHAHLTQALRRLALCCPLAGLSSVWETEPVGFTEQDPFWNLVVRIDTDLPPAALLGEVKRIEREVGRTPGFRNGPREIDIDVLLYGDIILRTESLEIPHPRMTGRAFVLRPLAEIDAGHVLPHTARTVQDHLDHDGPFEAARPLFSGRELLDS